MRGRRVVVAGRLLVVPARQVGLIDDLRVGALRRVLLGQARRCERSAAGVADPAVGRPARKQRIGVRRANRVGAGVEVGDVVVVGVEPVERVADMVGRVEEVLRAAHLGRLVEHLESLRRVELVHVGRAQIAVRDRHAADRRPGGHEAVSGAQRRERDRPGLRLSTRFGVHDSLSVNVSICVQTPLYTYQSESDATTAPPGLQSGTANVSMMFWSEEVADHA